MAKGDVTEITVSSSVGAKVQVVQFQYSVDFHYSMSQKHDVEGMTEKEVHDYRELKIKQLRDHLEVIAQEETDKLIEQREALRESKVE